MNRDELAHVLRAACRIGGDADIVVIGSQSILGTFNEDRLPPAATASIEADIAFLNDPDRAKADLVEGAIGELSGFHAEFGIYAEGVHLETAILPAGWKERFVLWELSSSLPAAPRFLERHDLVVSKLIAARPKDVAFVDALINSDLIDVETALDRAALVDDSERVRRERVIRHLCGYLSAR